MPEPTAAAVFFAIPKTAGAQPAQALALFRVQHPRKPHKTPPAASPPPDRHPCGGLRKNMFSAAPSPKISSPYRLLIPVRAAYECCIDQQEGEAVLKGLPEERAIMLAQYIIEEGATVRQAAARFGISKSTVHKDITERLKLLNRPLYLQAQQVLNKNKQERHIRGGLATKEKYRTARGE